MSKFSRRAIFALPIFMAVASKTLTASAAPASSTAVATVAEEAAAPTLTGTAAGWLFNKLEFPIHTLRVRYATPIPKPEELAEVYSGDGVLEAKPGNALSIQINKMHENEIEEFASVRDLFTSTFATTDISRENAANPNVLAVCINHQANLVAARTRRAAANILITSHDTQFPLGKLLEIPAMDAYEKALSESLEPDEMLILYRSTMQLLDGPFMAEIQENGSVKAVRTQNTTNTLGNYSDFGIILKIA